MRWAKHWTCNPNTVGNLTPQQKLCLNSVFEQTLPNFSEVELFTWPHCVLLCCMLSPLLIKNANKTDYFPATSQDIRCAHSETLVPRPYLRAFKYVQKHFNLASVSLFVLFQDSNAYFWHALEYISIYVYTMFIGIYSYIHLYIYLYPSIFVHLWTDPSSVSSYRTCKHIPRTSTIKWITFI